VSVFQVRRVAAAGGLALALGLLTACGGTSDAASSSSSPSSSSSSSTSSSSASSPAAGGSSSAAGQAQTLTVTEVGFDIRLESSDLPAGDYTITVKNDGDATHDLVVEQDGKDIAKSDTLGPGDSGTFTVTLEPGQYVFYCSIGNHRAMGMETDVTVS
jgi:plastocyanin